MVTREPHERRLTQGTIKGRVQSIELDSKRPLLILIVSIEDRVVRVRVKKGMKQVIVVRKDLNLSLGKIIAQAVHASQRTGIDMNYDIEGNLCVVVYCKSEIKLLSLYEKCLEAGVHCGLQRDAGKTEIEKGTPTVLSIGPDDWNTVTEITKNLQLIKVEVDWNQ